MLKDPVDILQEYWGYDAFRPLQEDIINSVLNGKDTLALLPTGGGKSICYQVPAMAMEGICIVVSPLIALMKDQVEQLKKRGILAASITSGQSRRQIVQTLKNVAHGPYKILYVSPERLETALFKEYLPAMEVNLIAVDEAHCVSQWGYDFRPAYLRIAALRAELPGVPMLALTASATADVQQDICEKLAFNEPAIFRQSYVRANLSYSVFNVASKPDKLVDIISKVPGTAIVYCSSRRRTTEIAGLLQLHGISSGFYHAGLPQEERAQRQQDWIDNKLRVMVCTNAFGMGIDKPDVRLVIHADLPDCLESYYQEAGRAGRDGKKAYAVLLYTERDIADLDALHEQRYPGFEEIRKMYSALVNFLQIPSYTGDDRSYPFAFEDCVKRFNLKPQLALASMKAMEGDGWIDFNEKSFKPATVMFTSNRQALQEFYETHPSLEELLTTLLRTYGGIWDSPVFISEKLLVGLLHRGMDDIRKELQQADTFGILKYSPQDDAPQVVFRRHRVNVEDFRIDLRSYHQRRDAFIARARKLVAYIHDTGCRSLFINRYFGDPGTENCGRCDNCIDTAKKPLTGAEAASIQLQIEALVAGGPMTASELQGKLPGTSKEKLWQVLDYLQAEHRLRMDERGRLVL